MGICRTQKQRTKHPANESFIFVGTLMVCAFSIFLSNYSQLEAINVGKDATTLERGWTQKVALASFIYCYLIGVFTFCLAKYGGCCEEDCFVF